MSMKHFVSLSLSCLLFVQMIVTDSVWAQVGYVPYATGCEIDREAYAAVPAAVPLLTRSYANVPDRHSLKQYCPEPQHQGMQSSCTGWAASYAALTILEASKRNWLDRKFITQQAFSPSYAYNQVRLPSTTCTRGALISRTLEVMVQQGVPKITDFPYECERKVTQIDKKKAAPFKLESYKRLSIQGLPPIDLMKKSISENKPVIIAMNCYKSFYQAKDVWNGVKNGYIGGHAMTIVGYDDKKHGGAVELMNSWGTQWGNDGFMWVRYEDLEKHGLEYYEVDGAPGLPDPTVEEEEEVVVKPTPKPKPRPKKPRFKPTPKKPKPNRKKNNKVITPPNPAPKPLPKTSVRLEGTIKLELDNGKEMKLYQESMSTRGFSVVEAAQSDYRLATPYPSGTRFRVYLDNKAPAYVYILGSDLATKKVGKIFPFENTSAYLNYKSNKIAFPSEHHFIQMDNTKGTDYLCVLYSKKKLDIEDIRQQLEASTQNHFVEKVNDVLKEELIAQNNVSFGKDKINFLAKSKDKSVVAIIVEIDHE